ncbi:nucleocapsid protein [Meliandou mastomys virus]|uniref:Nucleocapsid n=1 Tax=Meliandou mastomys virus TaxID=2940987 RepID=A0AAE9HRG2_9MONO|nr:nucleocapsid protein [Meliandou mastomys virus]
MSRLGLILDEFREFKNAPAKRGLISSALHGIKKSVIIPVPTFTRPDQRWFFMLFMLEIVWSEIASGAMITGALISLLSLFAENPGAMIRSLLNDPDLDVQIAEVSAADENGIKLATRGKKLDEFENEIMRVAHKGPPKNKGSSPWPFARKEADHHLMVTKTTEDFQIAVQTITVQLWILLTKAVTATDTARESERRRWDKFAQQRRADKDYQLTDGWLDFTRARMAEDISVRRYMVEVLIETGKMSGVRSRVIEIINDIGNYISEAGMAGFFLTIKYGIETKYPALALNELQADLSTVMSLMKLYTTLGDRAPFMVIVEDSIQTKFSPGNYPLLWSYAMGVGTVLDRAVNNLNYTRPYLENSFFRLGESMVEKMEGSVNNRMAAELELTPEQIEHVKLLAKIDSTQGQGTNKGPKINQTATRTLVAYDGDDIIPNDDFDAQKDGADKSYDPRKVTPIPNANSVFYQQAKSTSRRQPTTRKTNPPASRAINSLKESLNSTLEELMDDDSDGDTEEEESRMETTIGAPSSTGAMSDMDALRG